MFMHSKGYLNVSLPKSPKFTVENQCSCSWHCSSKAASKLGLLFLWHLAHAHRFTNMTSFGKKTAYGGTKKKIALIRPFMFCTVFDQSLDFLSHTSIYRKHFSLIQHNLKTIYEIRHMKKADQRKRHLLLYKLGSPRWRWFTLLSCLYIKDLS